MLRRHHKRQHRPPHSLMRRPQDIDTVDLLVLHNRHRPAHIPPRRNLHKNLLPHLRRQFLRVIHQPMSKPIRQHHRRRHHRPAPPPPHPPAPPTARAQPRRFPRSSGSPFSAAHSRA